MKRSPRFRDLSIFFLLVACSAAGPETTVEANSSNELNEEVLSGEQPLLGASVVFYNVENLFDTHDDPATNDQDFLPTSELSWTEERLKHKLGHLAEAISMTDGSLPVLVGLAEVENGTVVKALAAEADLAKARYAVAHFESPDERGIDVALLYKSEVFKLENSEPLNVDLGDDRTRDILHAELSSQGHTYHVFVNHWPSRREGPEKSEPKRMEAAQVLRNAVENIAAGPTVHVIIMGDFNDSPHDNSIQRGLGAECSKGTSSLVDLMCIGQPAGTGSYTYQGEWQYLDQFIVDPITAEQVQSAMALTEPRIMFNHPKNGPSPNKTYSGGHYKGGYSDHLPIVMKFR